MMLMNKNVKMGARYGLLIFFMYLAYYVVQPEWIVYVKDVDSVILGVVYGSIYGALTLVIKSHFETKIGD